MGHSSRFLSTFGSVRAEFGESGRQKRGIHPVFLSTFETARPEFRLAGRQKRGISLGFCLLSGSCTSNLEGLVDKNHTFLPFFVYFRGRAPRFKRTAEIPPKQETLRRCLMTAALHFEFPSRPLSRFVAVRASKAVRALSKALHYQR